jgi:hypothetical protein
MPLNRVRQTPIKAGAYRRSVFTKLGDHCLLTFLHNEKAGSQPDQQYNANNQANTNPGALQVRLKTAARTIVTHAATDTAADRVFYITKQATQFAIEITPQLVEVGRTLVGTPLLTALIAIPGGRIGCFGILALRLGLGFARVRWLVVAATPPGVVQIEHPPNSLWPIGPAQGV